MRALKDFSRQGIYVLITFFITGISIGYSLGCFFTEKSTEKHIEKMNKEMSNKINILEEKLKKLDDSRP